MKNLKYIKIYEKFTSKVNLNEEYNVEDDIDDVRKERINKLGEKIKEIETKYKNTRILLFGKIWEISFSSMGEVLRIGLTGDVPSGFKNIDLLIVHPDAEKDGWIGKGGIGINIGGKSGKISDITLPKETINQISEIYKDYTDKSPNWNLFRIDTNSKEGDLSNYYLNYLNDALNR